MTVMSDHAARLSDTAHLLVLDPSLGPVARHVSALALGDEILVVAGGRMCFRRVMSAEEATPPDAVVQIAPGSLGLDMPKHALSLDSRQMIGVPTSQGPLSPAYQLGSPLSGQGAASWVDITAEGADRIFVENVTIAAGQLPMAVVPTPDVPLSSPEEPTLKAVQTSTADGSLQTRPSPIRAFNGPAELPLAGASTEATFTTYRFVLPPRTTTLRLSSPSTQPPGDGRKLGIAILSLLIEGNEIPLDSPALVRGFHRAESGEGRTWRWTDGDALLILPPKPVPQTMSVNITDWDLML